MDLGTLLFSFSGRINRAKYWAGSLALIAGLLAVFILVLAVPTSVTLVVFLLALIPIVIAGLALGVKRLHDRDKSGWWILLFYWLPGVFERIGDRIGIDMPVAWLLYAISLGLSIWAFVELGYRRGTAGANRFGPDPLATGGPALSPP